MENNLKESNVGTDRYHIEQDTGEIIYSNLPKDCLDCFMKCNGLSETIDRCSIDEKKRKRGKISSEKGTIYYCTSSQDIINSSRIFKEKLKIYYEILDDFDNLKKLIKEEINKDTKRLIHNLTSINAHSIQEIYALVPQEILTQDISRQHEVIKQMILDDPDEATKTFLRIAKNNATMKTEFSVFKKLNDTSPALSFKLHLIRKVLMNVFHIFFQDFTDKGVVVSVEASFEYVLVDYESIFVAFYHIIENTTKYIASNTKLRVLFLSNENSFIIRFEMMSVQIKIDEVDTIFLEGMKGEMAKKTKQSGEGIGLFIVKKLLALNNCTLKIQVNTNPYLRKVMNQIQYENNQFDVVFPKRSAEDKDLQLQ